MTYTLERSIRIYNNDSGAYIYVGPDADGFNLIELRYVVDDRIPGCISFDKEQARLVADAIYELIGKEMLHAGS